MSLTHLSLFTGIGGIDLAAEWAGFETVGQCEWKDFPTSILKKHFPDVARWRDIHTLTKEGFYERTNRRSIKLISGGFPCQPFSVAGKRLGKDDDRYLWDEMCRVVKELQPTWVIGENVAGLVTMAEQIAPARVESRTVNRNSENDFYEAVLTFEERMLLEGIIKDLENIEYEVQPFVIPACGVGANHRRERIFIVAHSNSIGRDARCNNQPRGYVPSNEQRNDSKGKPTRNGWVDRIGATCADVANTERGNAQEFELRFGASKGQGGKTSTRFSDGSSAFGEWWSVEPDVGRVANGVPDRVDRLTALGNAVVPQQVYPILKAIADIEKRE